MYLIKWFIDRRIRHKEFELRNENIKNVSTIAKSWYHKRIRRAEKIVGTRRTKKTERIRRIKKADRIRRNEKINIIRRNQIRNYKYSTYR